MRLGVLDIGSNTVHLLVVDAYPGAAPLPAFSHKVDLRSPSTWTRTTRCPSTGEKQLTEVVAEALRIAEDKGVEDFIAFATSAVRDADNGDDVLSRVQERTGAHIRVLSGENEARLTFLAARRWFGWSSGRLLVVDIGGGSLEIAAGQDEEPEVVMSLPLGAGRLTRDWFSTDPPPQTRCARCASTCGRRSPGRPAACAAAVAVDHAVGTSKTFRQLAQDRRRGAVERGLLREAVPQAQRRRPAGRSGWRRWTAPSAPGCPGSPRAGRPRCRPAPSWRTR